MSVSKQNPEGYQDMTAYEAVKKTTAKEQKDEYRPMVFICSPYAGNVDENTERARAYCRTAVNLGYLPVAPHLFFPQFLNDSNMAERNLGLLMGQVMLTKCREIWVFGDTISDGMRQEIRKARVRNMSIRYFNRDCQEVYKTCAN